MAISEDTLIYDIETKTFGTPDPEKDELRLFGCYSYKTKKSYVLSNIDDIIKIIKAHKYLVGFNTKNYDNPILKRFDINLDYKIFLDLFEIIKKRSGIIKTDNGDILKDILMSYSLDSITRVLGLVTDDEAKMKFDYTLLNKPMWTPDEARLIKAYTERDIDITKRLYEFLESYFQSFEEFLPDESIRKKHYLISSPASFGYQAVCKEMGWNVDYAKDDMEEGENILGGYVAYPAGEFFEDDMYYFDFASLYPTIMFQCNIYGRKKLTDINDRPTWNGGGMWQVEGEYYSDVQEKISLMIKRWFEKRTQYKKEKNPKEYTYKILINLLYGILDKASMEKTYDKIGAGDVTRLGRQFIRYVRKRVREEGYINIMADTDSDVIKDVYHDKERLFTLIRKIADEIRHTLPFPSKHFDMKLEDEVKHFYFFKPKKEDSSDDDDINEMDDEDFKNKPLGLLKKNYIYVNTDGKVKIKNLGIRKKSNSELSKKIFWEYFVPQMKKGKHKFAKTYIRNLILELLEKNMSLIQIRYEVGPYSQYAEKSPNSIHAQISQRYGSGVHFLIPNNRIGVGKDKKYCTMDEFKQNNLRFDNIDLDNVWNELGYFIQIPKAVKIFDF